MPEHLTQINSPQGDGYQAGRDINISEFPKLKCIFDKPYFDSEKFIKAGIYALLSILGVIIIIFGLTIALGLQNFDRYEKEIFQTLKFFATFCITICVLFSVIEVSYRLKCFQFNFKDKQRSIAKYSLIFMAFSCLFLSIEYYLIGFYKISYVILLFFIYFELFFFFFKSLLNNNEKNLEE